MCRPLGTVGCFISPILHSSLHPWSMSSHVISWPKESIDMKVWQFRTWVLRFLASFYLPSCTSAATTWRTRLGSHAGPRGGWRIHRTEWVYPRSLGNQGSQSITVEQPSQARSRQASTHLMRKALSNNNTIVITTYIVYYSYTNNIRIALGFIPWVLGWLIAQKQTKDILDLLTNSTNKRFHPNMFEWWGRHFLVNTFVLPFVNKS